MHVAMRQKSAVQAAKQLDVRPIRAAKMKGARGL
jgi:hypothetical protein